MSKYSFPIILSALGLLASVSVAAALENLPLRETPAPQTTNSVPHVQIGVQPVPELSQELLRRVGNLPQVVIAPTQVSLPGASGFHIRENVPIARPEVIVGGREFAHLHPDGSLHASLSPEMAREAVSKGWATPHPWSSQREGWEGFVMIYTPQTQDELDIVFELVRGSLAFVMGR